MIRFNTPSNCGHPFDLILKDVLRYCVDNELPIDRAFEDFDYPVDAELRECVIEAAEYILETLKGNA